MALSKALEQNSIFGRVWEGRCHYSFDKLRWWGVPVLLDIVSDHPWSDEQHRPRWHPEVPAIVNLVAEFAGVNASECGKGQGITTIDRQADEFPESSHEISRHFTLGERPDRAEPSDRPNVIAESDISLVAQIRIPAHLDLSSRTMTAGRNRELSEDSPAVGWEKTHDPAKVVTIQ